MNNAVRQMSGYIMLAACLTSIGMAVHLSNRTSPGIGMVVVPAILTSLGLRSLRKVAHPVPVPRRGYLPYVLPEETDTGGMRGSRP